MEGVHFVVYRNGMDQTPFPDWFFFVALGWVVLVFVISAVVRRVAGKPLIPKIPENALFAERWASGRWASNCLLVSVTPGELTVVPKFPFNLGFLPDVYGLERRIPLSSVNYVKQTASLIGNNVVVQYDDEKRKLGLKLRNPRSFVDVLGSQGIRSI